MHLSQAAGRVGSVGDRGLSGGHRSEEAFRVLNSTVSVSATCRVVKRFPRNFMEKLSGR